MDLFLQQRVSGVGIPGRKIHPPRQWSNEALRSRSVPSTAGPVFPLRAAAIDVGSNALRFVAVEFTDPSRFSPLDSVRAPVRLGVDAFRTGVLSPEVVDEAVLALADFRRRMDALSVVHYRAVATSAVRDSKNGGRLVERAHEQCRIRLEPITGIEEVRLVWLAVRNRVELGDQRWILVDLGGGSMEISLIDRERVHRSESEPLGTVRLLEEAARTGAGSADRLRRMLEEHPVILKIAGVIRLLEPASMIGTGGNIEALAELAGVQPDARGVRRLTSQELGRILDVLASLPPSERMRRFGMRQDRADVIVPAAMIYQRIARMMEADEIVVPGVGVKDGVLLDVVHALLDQGTR